MNNLNLRIQSIYHHVRVRRFRYKNLLGQQIESRFLKEPLHKSAACVIFE